MVFQAGGGRVLSSLSRRSLIYLALSGLATGVSWLAYFRALQLGPASRVAPIDKLSLPPDRTRCVVASWRSCELEGVGRSASDDRRRAAHDRMS